MVKMPKKPASWDNEFNPIQTSLDADAPTPGWQEDSTFVPTPGGVLDGLPKQGGGSTFEWLFGPVSESKASAGLGDVAGKAWNLPNTAIGLGYGALGYMAGWPSHWLGLQDDPPGVSLRNNAVQFTDNPFGGVGAITIGNAEVINGKPIDHPRKDPTPIGQHEEQHTYQGEQLGPFYLPSNALGGMAGVLIDGDWHGPHNWNEVGPLKHPPVPWPK